MTPETKEKLLKAIRTYGKVCYQAGKHINQDIFLADTAGNDRDFVYGQIEKLLAIETAGDPELWVTICKHCGVTKGFIHRPLCPTRTDDPKLKPIKTTENQEKEFEPTNKNIPPKTKEERCAAETRFTAEVIGPIVKRFEEWNSSHRHDGQISRTGASFFSKVVTDINHPMYNGHIPWPTTCGALKKRGVKPIYRDVTFPLKELLKTSKALRESEPILKSELPWRCPGCGCTAIVINGRGGCQMELGPACHIGRRLQQNRILGDGQRAKSMIRAESTTGSLMK